MSTSIARKQILAPGVLFFLFFFHKIREMLLPAVHDDTIYHGEGFKELNFQSFSSLVQWFSTS